MPNFRPRAGSRRVSTDNKTIFNLQGELAGPGIKLPSHFHWTSPDNEAPPKNYKSGEIQAPPVGKSLRLPLGIASDFTLENIKVKVDSDTSQGITPHHTRSLLEVCAHLEHGVHIAH